MMRKRGRCTVTLQCKTASRQMKNESARRDASTFPLPSLYWKQQVFAQGERRVRFSGMPSDRTRLLQCRDSLIT
eukprot:1148547-Pelagomonas_calceolata.AAC.1